MANISLVAGTVLLIFGVATFAGVIPLSVFASSVSVNCGNWPAQGCTVIAQITNSGIPSGANPPFTAYFVYKDSNLNTLLIDQQSWSPSAASVTDTLTPSALAQNGAVTSPSSVTVFFWASGGQPLGVSTTQTFSVPIQFRFYYSNVGSVTVNPPGGSPLNCVTGVCLGTANVPYYQAWWPFNTALAVTTSAGVAPVFWGSSASTNCPASGAGFICTIPVQQQYSGQAFIQSSTSSIPYNTIEITATNGGGGVSPNTICLSSTSYSNPNFGQCNTQGTFTLSMAAQWSLQTQSGSAIQTGSGTSASFTFSQLSSMVSFSSGVAYLTFVSSMPSTLTILAPAYGAISPPAGTYVCSTTSSTCVPGGTVSMSVNVPSGDSLLAWIVNGQSVGTANPYTLSIPMTGTTSITAVVQPCTTPASCGTGGGGPPSLSSSQIIGGVSSAAGIGLILMGLRKKR